ncbi:MAG: nitroreductase [Clostridia bacterium]|nr:nitroreductase [Clostridia bacterium]
MDIKEAVIKRHSVRRYLDKPIEANLVEALKEKIEEINRESGLKITLVTDEATAFTGPLAHYGKFENCKNYFVICGKRGLEEKVGYFGEKLVIFSQMIGLNTCWVALTYKRGSVPIKAEKGERLYIVISVGYGRNRGLPRKSKPIERLCRVKGEMPEWFKNGMDFAMRAPTAINQQKFLITLEDDGRVRAKSLLGPCHKIDLGIVKYHFELGAGKDSFQWVE